MSRLSSLLRRGIVYGRTARSDTRNMAFRYVCHFAFCALVEPVGASPLIGWLCAHKSFWTGSLRSASADCWSDRLLHVPFHRKPLQPIDRAVSRTWL